MVSVRMHGHGHGQVRRDGVYNSASSGPIDMNQELTDPVEAAMMVGWDVTMNKAVNELLGVCLVRCRCRWNALLVGWGCRCAAGKGE